MSEIKDDNHLQSFQSDGVDRSANAIKPVFNSEQEIRILNALKYAAETQKIYLELMQEGEGKREAPAPSPYPAYSLAPTFSTTSSTTVSTVNNPFPVLPPTISVNTPSSTNVLQLHNLSILSRVYVGSINFELTESDLKTAFSVFGPVKSISLSIDPITQHHKGYCFIEFETPEAAALALETMNGSELGGRSIKVGRSNNFPTDLPPGIPRPLTKRIYVSNVHEAVTEKDVMDIFASFGTIKGCSLIPDTNNRNHKGYGYIEFEEDSPALASMVALKNFNLGGLELKIGRTIVGGDLPMGMSVLEKLPSHKGKKSLPAAVINAAKSINQIITYTTTPEEKPESKIELTKAFEQKATVKSESIEANSPMQSNKDIPGVMLLTNMIMANELDEEAQEEVVEECKRYGEVIDIYCTFCSARSPSHNISSYEKSQSLDDFVHFYVIFSDQKSAQAAIQVFNGRFFAGKRVNAKYLDYNHFKSIQKQ